MRKREKTYLPDASAFPVGVPAGVIDAVRALYEACSTRRVTWPLNARVGCCMDAQLAREMCDWDLRSLTATHVYEYQDAAHDAAQDADEYLHFLPKVAELISQGDTGLVRHSTEIVLERLGGFDHALLSQQEKHAIAHWALALWQWWLDSAGEGKFALRYETADGLLVMFARAGLSIDPMLASWQRCESSWAAVQFGLLMAEIDTGDLRANGFADPCEELVPTIHAWAYRSEVYMHFAAIWEQLSDRDALRLCASRPATEVSVCESLGPRLPGNAARVSP